MAGLTKAQQKILASFNAGADDLEKEIAGLTEKQLDLSVSPGQWSIRQIVHHVADDGDVWSFVLKRALVTPGSPLGFPEGFPGNEAWADALAFHKRSVKNTVKLLIAHRAVITELAEHFPDAWDRYLTIPDDKGNEARRFTIEEIISMVAEHLYEHIATIRAIKLKHGV